MTEINMKINNWIYNRVVYILAYWKSKSNKDLVLGSGLRREFLKEDKKKWKKKWD